MQPVSQAEQ